MRPVFSERLVDQPETKHLVIRAGDALAAHWSPKRITLVCLSGDGTLSAGEEEVSLAPGTCVVISPRLQHAVQARSDCHLLLFLD